MLQLIIFALVFLNAVVNGLEAGNGYKLGNETFYFKAFIFNLTNLDEILESGDWSTVPRFEENGPYIYKEIREKYDIREGPNDTVFYRQNFTYVFDEDLNPPNFTENSKLNIVNVPFITVLSMLSNHRQLKSFAEPVFQSLLRAGESLFLKNVAVCDLLFKGIPLKPVYQEFEFIARSMGIPLPGTLQNGKFAFFPNKNDTEDDNIIWQVYRGLKNPNLKGTIKSMDGKTSLEPWWDSYCAMLNGTDGTIFPPAIQKDTRLFVFAREICRSVFLEFQQEVDYGNVTAYRFKMSPNNFAGPDACPQNWCFCMPQFPGVNATCNFSGVQRLFSCRNDFPLITSKPHFLDADANITDQALQMGLHPSEELHDYFMDIDPTTGEPLAIHQRLQTGIELPSLKTFGPSPFDKVDIQFYPLSWSDVGTLV